MQRIVECFSKFSGRMSEEISISRASNLRGKDQLPDYPKKPSQLNSTKIQRIGWTDSASNKCARKSGELKAAT